MMRWFKRKQKSHASEPPAREKGMLRGVPQSAPPPLSSQVLAKLPTPILERIFSFVCPHSQDESYESCEQSAIEDTCMLCDLRDLAHCAQVSTRWRTAATNVL